MMKKLVVLTLICCACVGAYLVKKDFFFSRNTDQSLNLILDSKIKTFDPVNAFDDDSLMVMAQSVQMLYQYHYLKRPYEIIPNLAESLPVISNNGKKYIIKIKRGVFYHPHQAFKGKRELLANDFVLQMKRVAFAPLKSVGRFLFEGKILGFNRFSKVVGDNFEKIFTTPLEGFRAIDDYTLEINLLRPEPNLLYFLAMTFTAPLPEELVRFTQNDFSTTLIGTGPFKFLSYKNKIYEFIKNENYFKEFYPSRGDRYANTQDLLKNSKEKLPFLNKIKFHVIEKKDEQVNSFFSKKLDIISVPKAYLAEVSSQQGSMYQKIVDEKIEVKHYSKLATRWLGFNMQSQLVGKGKKARYLRLAIAHAIDYDKYIKNITGNTNLRANSILNPSIPGYNPSHNTPYSFDLDKAKKFLQLAGYSHKNTPTIVFSTRGNTESHLKEASFFKSQLEQLGLKVELEILSFRDFLKKGRSGKLKHLWIDNWIYDYPDAENILALLTSKNYPGVNKSGYVNREVDKLYEKLSQTLDKKSRFEIMYKIEKNVMKNIPWVMLMYESSYTLQRPEIKNFRKSYFIKNFAKYIEK